MFFRGLVAGSVAREGGREGVAYKAGCEQCHDGGSFPEGSGVGVGGVGGRGGGVRGTGGGGGGRGIGVGGRGRGVGVGEGEGRVVGREREK